MNSSQTLDREKIFLLLLSEEVTYSNIHLVTFWSSMDLRWFSVILTQATRSVGPGERQRPLLKRIHTHNNSSAVCVTTCLHRDYEAGKWVRSKKGGSMLSITLHQSLFLIMNGLKGKHSDKSAIRLLPGSLEDNCSQTWLLAALFCATCLFLLLQESRHAPSLVNDLQMLQLTKWHFTVV